MPLLKVKRQPKFKPGQPLCSACPVMCRTEWSSLPDPEVTRLEQHKSSRIYNPGEVVFPQGGRCEGVFCIRSGTVALRKGNSQGQTVITRLLHPGQTLGYRTFFSGGIYTATALALTRSEICFVGEELVRSLVRQNPSLAERFLKHLAQDLRSAEEAKLSHVMRPVRARLAELLLALADRYGEDGDDGTLDLELPLARQDMAALIGVRPESVARAIRALDDDGVAHFDGRHVRIPDLDALMHEVDHGDGSGSSPDLNARSGARLER
jgi:CRP-like cAMP-binding protein